MTLFALSGAPILDAKTRPCSCQSSLTISRSSPARDGSNPALLTGCHPAGSSTQVTTWSQRSARASSVRMPTSRLSTTYACRRVPSDAASNAFACSSMKLLDRLPLRP